MQPQVAPLRSTPLHFEGLWQMRPLGCAGLFRLFKSPGKRLTTPFSLVTPKGDI